jgi:diaminohydroxyphosphoribosylaminopyrimidine deaminase/5-amino-6-(5-phosphoribosylamino)uracil reductase
VPDRQRDDEVMRQAIDVAAAARRVAPPWPHVGCVLVRDGAVVGAAATGPFRTGGHAETNALAQAGDRASRATAYVTLEPCSHHGNTPPCADALIAAGIARVVVGIEDPDPRVAGQGIARLRAAGLDVTIGVLAADVEQQLAAYLHHRRTGRAYVVLKTAASLDGRIAAPDGSSQWITGPAARADAHARRADSQAIIVGGGTATHDRPALTVRDLPAHDDALLGPAPLRVLLDARGRTPADGPLFDVTLAPTLAVTTPAADPDGVAAWKAKGVEVVEVGSGATGHGVDLDATLRLLADRGVLQVMVEGGAALHAAFLAEARAQRLVTYVGATLLGPRALPALPLDTVATIADAPRFTLTGVQRLGNDVRLDHTLEPAAHGPER